MENRKVPDQSPDPKEETEPHGGRFSLDRFDLCFSQVGCSGLAGGDLFADEGVPLTGRTVPV